MATPERVMHALPGVAMAMSGGWRSFQPVRAPTVSSPVVTTIRLSLILALLVVCAWTLGSRVAGTAQTRFPADPSWDDVPPLRVLLVEPVSGRDSHARLELVALQESILTSPDNPRLMEQVPVGGRITLTPGGAEGIVVDIPELGVRNRWSVAAIHLLPARRTPIAGGEPQPEPSQAPLGRFEHAERRAVFRLNAGAIRQDYRGSLRVVPDGAQALRAINVLPLEAWVMGMLGGELSGSWPEAALLAQAVAGRSYALASALARADREWHLTNSSDEPTYLGDLGSPLPIRLAVVQTKGRVLTVHGDPFKALFHAASGGQTACVADVDPALTSVRQGLPLAEAMPSRSDPACFAGIAASGREASHGRRTFVVRPDYLRARLKEALDHPHWVSEVDCTRHPGGRVKQVFLRSRDAGGRRELELSGEKFRALIGGKDLRSTLWSEDSPRKLDGNDGQGWAITTLGWGHGAGLSQVSAYAMALDGQDHLAILKFFYPSAEVTTVW